MTTHAIPKMPNDISTVFDKATPPQKALLIRLRQMVFETAASLDGVGQIEETLKWGQPTFTTVRPKSGSPFRLAPLTDGTERIALYFICTTNLVARFREHYGDELEFEGNRAIILDAQRPLPEAEIAHCMAMALRYFKDK